MKKQAFIATLTGIMMLASVSTAFAATDISRTSIKDANYIAHNPVYNDAQPLAERYDTLKANASAKPSMTSYKERRDKKDASAPTGYVYAAYGWVNMSEVHRTTAQLEFRSGGGSGEVYASKRSKYSAGKVEALTGYVPQVGEAYVYYDIQD